MGTPLTGNSAGASYTRVMQNGGGTLGAGYYLQDGAGTETPLWLGSGAIGLKSPGGSLQKIESKATAARQTYVADAPGTISPETILLLAADATANTTTVLAAITALNFTPETNGRYEFEILALFTSAVAATGMRLDLDGPAEVTGMWWQSRGPLTVTSETVGYGGVKPASYLGTAVPVAGTVYLATIKGMFTMTGTPASPMQILVAAEVGGGANSVVLKAGTMVRFRKLN